MQTLSSLFQASDGAAVEFGGRLVQPIFQMPLQNAETRFTVHRVSSASSPVQGLCIKATKGGITVNGQSHSQIILWADTSPDTVEIVISSKRGGVLKAWNVWRSGDLTQAWIGNAGMHVSSNGGKTILECSDGVQDVDFTNLVIELEESS
jgi:hypothetical protein